MTIVSKNYGSPVTSPIAKPKPIAKPCPQLPGTILRIFIPAGAVINLLNLIEVTSPAGICLIVRLPFLAGRKGAGPIYSDLVNAVQAAGGKVEFSQE